jgi:hypothetical protein
VDAGPEIDGGVDVAQAVASPRMLAPGPLPEGFGKCAAGGELERHDEDAGERARARAAGVLLPAWGNR